MATHFYELRDDIDDLPYQKTYATIQAAEKAARAKARKQGHEIFVYQISDKGEFCEGVVW